MIRELVSELRADAASAKAPAAVSTGLVVAVLILVFGPTQAATIFAGPLAPFVAQGTGMVLFGCFTLCLIAALTGSYRGTVSMPNFAPAVALFAMGSAVAASMSSASGQAVLATMVAVIALGTAMSGLCFVLIGGLRLGSLFRFMPYPLVGGFLAGLGGVLSVSSISIACGVALEWETRGALLEPDMVWRWAPSVVYAVVLLVVTKLRPHYLVLPASVVLAVGLYHAALFFLGIAADDARAAGFLFVGMPASTSWPPIELGDLAYVDWNVVASRIQGILGVMLITLICIVLNAGALELGSGRELDMNREFQAEGAACLVASFGASSPGCNSSPMSLISHATGAETRLTGIVVALVVGSVLFFGGELLGLLPNALLGGLALFVGLGLLNDWLVATRETLPRADYGIVLLVCLTICFFGFLEGVVVGLVAAVVFFVARYSATDVIADAFSARTRRSGVVRSAAEHAIVSDHGERVNVYRLRGHIIFGNAAPLGGRLNEALEVDPAPMYIVLDFAGVSGFDVSAANVMSRCIRAARTHGTRIVLCAVDARLRSVLRGVLPAGDWDDVMIEKDLDGALQRCEDALIAKWERLHSESEVARDALFGMSVDHAVRELDRQVRFEALTERLAPWVQPCAYVAGENVVIRGEIQKGLQLLTEGRASARAGRAGAPAQQYGPGDVLAARAVLGPHAAENSVTAQGPCRTMLMTSSARCSLERDDAELSVELDRYLLETILNHYAAASRR